MSQKSVKFCKKFYKKAELHHNEKNVFTKYSVKFWLLYVAYKSIIFMLTTVHVVLRERYIVHLETVHGHDNKKSVQQMYYF